MWGVKDKRKKGKESARNVFAKDTNPDVGYWSREITSIGAMTYCEGTSVESSLEPQGLRPDWEIMVYGATSPPAWRRNNWWTMENNVDYSCEQMTDLQFPSSFCMAHFWVDINRHILRQRNPTFWRVKFLSNYVSNLFLKFWPAENSTGSFHL